MSARHDIGGNNPPEPIVTYREKVALYKESAEALGPVSDANAQEYRDLMGFGVKLAKEIDGQRDLEKRPHLEAGRLVDGAYKPVIETAEAVKKGLQNKLGSWLAKKEEEARRAAAEARRKAEEAERLAAEQEAEDDPFLAATAPTVDVAVAVVEAKVAESQALAAGRVSSAAGGFSAVGLKTKRSAKVTDWSALAAHYIGNGELRACLERLANADIRHAKSAPIEIPGVQVIEERVL